MQASAAINLTGAWQADDGAVYYVRHLDDNSLWWAGLHTFGSGFHPGVAFTNVFRGTVNPTAKTIDGLWADVPREINVLRQGRLSLDIVALSPPDPGDDAPPPGKPRPSRTTTFQLRQKPEGTSGGFGGKIWTPWIAELSARHP